MSCRPALESTQPPIQWVQVALSQAVTQPGHEADHSLPASAEVKKMWIYTSVYVQFRYFLVGSVLVH
jgi:hypothetical protein